MSRAFAVAGGLLFASSLLIFVWSYGWRFDAGAGPWPAHGGWGAVIFDAALFTIFALHHSIFARPWARALVERTVPDHLERSVYVWLASVLLLAVCFAWQAVPGVLWRIEGSAAWGLRAVQLFGVVLSVVSAGRLDTLSLAGVRQVMDPVPSGARPGAPVLDGGPYRYLRHPIYLGWFLMVWSAPLMNGTRLVFAAISCIYLLIAIPFEERDLRRAFGPAYGHYARQVRWRVVPGVW